MILFKNLWGYLHLIQAFICYIWEIRELWSARRFGRHLTVTSGLKLTFRCVRFVLNCVLFIMHRSESNTWIIFWLFDVFHTFWTNPIQMLKFSVQNCCTTLLDNIFLVKMHLTYFSMTISHYFFNFIYLWLLNGIRSLLSCYFQE